jgi:hypothetical protein
MPSLLGALAGVIAYSAAKLEDYDADQISQLFPEKGRSVSDQAITQFEFILITLATSFFGGAFTGVLMRHVEPTEGGINPDNLFRDEDFWAVPTKEFPYYYDKRGEIKSHGQTEATVHNGAASKADTSQFDAKINVLDAAMRDLRKRLAVRTSSPLLAPQPAPQSQGSDMELKLMISKLINKVDEQAINYQHQVVQLMASANNGRAASSSNDKNPNSPSASRVYID